MSSHTPGPWKFNGRSKSGNNNFNVVGTQLGGMYKIARCPFNNEYDEKEVESNAKLIAAAPDLLEALEAIKDYCRYHDIMLGSGIIEQVNNAIESATQLDNQK